MVWSKGFWSADGGLDADLFEARNAIDGALDVNAEDVPVKFVQAESKIAFNLRINWSNLDD